MCLLVLAWRTHPRYRLIVAANRDEYHARPTAPMAVWKDVPDMLAGRDLSALGTWLAVDPLAPFRDHHPLSRDGTRPAPRGAQSRRPRSPSGYARGDAPETSLESGWADAQRYAGFNLLLNDADRLYYASNRAPKFSRALEPGVYGLSNLLLDTPWPKLTRVRGEFEQWLAEQSAGAPPSGCPRRPAPHCLPCSLIARAACLMPAPARDPCLLNGLKCSPPRSWCIPCSGLAARRWR